MFLYAGIGAIAYLGYRVLIQPQMGLISNSPFQKPVGGWVNGQLMGQPSQQYPFQPINPPRVDNSNQPWYGGNRLAAQGPTQMSAQPAPIQNDAMMVKAGADIITGLKSIWSDLGVGDWFTSNDNEVEALDNASGNPYAWD